MNKWGKSILFWIVVLSLLRSIFADKESTALGMVVDLGETGRCVRVTPDYSNAVMSAVLPYFSDVAKKLDLPVPQPITRADVVRVHFLPFLSKTSRDPWISIALKNGWAFTYEFGYLHLAADARGYSSLQDPGQVPRYYGQVRMTRSEAVQFARDALKKLGIPLEDVFAEQEPRVTEPIKFGTNTVPHYEIDWLYPWGGDSADIHINANTKRIERIYFLNKNLEHKLKIGFIPPPVPPDWPPVNPEYARQIIPIMLQAIEDYSRTLSLPVPRPLTTDDVARVEIHDNVGWPHAEITLTNGWRFIYRHTMVNGFYSPHNLFDSDNRKIHFEEFEGKWNFTTNQAIEFVRRAMARLDYPTNHVHMGAPSHLFAASVGKEQIPRLKFQWYYSVDDDLQSKIEAEVNTENGRLESLYYDDKAYWDSRPAIDVPISSGKYPSYPQ